MMFQTLLTNKERTDQHTLRHNQQLDEKMREALQEFVDRVEKGEVQSKYHYRKFKNLLSV